MKTTIYNQEGEKTGEFTLPEAVFNLPWNADLMHQVVVSMQANKRSPWAHIKFRGEVSGTGKKPWPQKGTGQARHGSKRSPIWVGGGVSHGPRKEKDYSKKINKKMKKKALFIALSQKLRDHEILFLDKIILSQPKTKEAAVIIKNLAGIKNFEKLAGRKKNRAILALPKKDAEIERGFRNIPGMQISRFNDLNALTLANYKYLTIAEPKEVIKA